MVNSWQVDERWAAPGVLEQIRRLINTSESAYGEDTLTELAGSKRAWRTHFGDVPPPGPGELGELRSLRSALRQALDDPSSVATIIPPWLEAHPVVTQVVDTQGGPVVALEAADTTASGAFLAHLATAISTATWPRLRSCPDCGLAFFDRSRNRSRRWCGMYAGENGRACGSIAKVRRWRQRQSEG